MNDYMNIAHIWNEIAGNTAPMKRGFTFVLSDMKGAFASGRDSSHILTI